MSDIAIVGLSCRFPGAKDKNEFWNNLVNGVDSVGEIPSFKWSQSLHSDNLEKKGSIRTRNGGFLDEELINKLDNEFFSITGREVASMDPQQMMLLELTYEAIKDAGLKASFETPKPWGVFVGICQADACAVKYVNLPSIDTYTATGLSFAIAANRISNVFNLTGPSFSLDTACSSSLFALHQAISSLHNNECECAIVGGINLYIHPGSFVSFSELGVLSPNGKCKTFDDAADGYVRGEGGGVVVVKKLTDAIRDGDHIYAVVKGSNVNADGGGKTSLTTPSSIAQMKNLEQAYVKSNIDPRSVYYVESHGTGTPVGDAAEALSIGSFFGRNGRESLINVGSVKTNIGHLEGASGIASLIKVLLMLQNRHLVPHLHFKTPSRKIDFEKLKLNVVTEAKAIPESEELLVMGVNSFGFGGANAHVILSEFKENSNPSLTKQPNLEKDEIVLIPISAQSPNSLLEIAKSLRNSIDSLQDENLIPLSISLFNHVDHFKYRKVFQVSSIENLKKSLEEYVKTAESELSSMKPTQKSKLAFVFCGQGPQWQHMGKQLFQRFKTYRNIVTEMDKLFQQESGWSLLEKWENLTEEECHQPCFAQPALFFLQVGLFHMLKECGIHSDGIIGHSMGEVSSFYASGVLSLEQAVKVIYVRSNCQQKTYGNGRMLAVSGLNIEEVQELIVPYQGNIEIASFNSPTSFALAGSNDDIQVLSESLTEKKIFNRILKGGCAFHSHFQDSIKDEISSTLSEIVYLNPNLPLYSTVTGDQYVKDSNYWWNNIRNPVIFDKTIENMIKQDEFNIFIEIGPHPVLINSIQEINKSQQDISTLFTLKRNLNETNCFLNLISEIYSKTLNGNIHLNGNLYETNYSWKELLGKLNLPLLNYPWNRTSSMNYSKITSLNSTGNKLCGELAQDISHPKIFKSQMSIEKFPFIEDHFIQGTCLYPGVGMVAMCLQAALEGHDEEQVSAIVENVKFVEGFSIKEEESVSAQVSIIAENDNSLRKQHVSLHSLQKLNWTKHAEMNISILDKMTKPEKKNITEILSRCQRKMDVKELYDRLFEYGIELGPQFQRVESLFLNGNFEYFSIINRIEVDNQVFGLDVPLLDALLHSVGGLAIADFKWMPIGIGQFKFYEKPSSEKIYLYGVYDNGGFDCYAMNEDGSVFLTIHGVSFKFFIPPGKGFVMETPCNEVKLEKLEVTERNDIPLERVVILGGKKHDELVSNLVKQFETNSIEVLLDVPIDLSQNDCILFMNGLCNQENPLSSYHDITETVKQLSLNDFSLNCWILTSDGACNVETVSDMCNGGLLGFGRAIRAEQLSFLRLRNLDIYKYGNSEIVKISNEIFNVILNENSESEIYITEEGLQVPRLSENVLLNFKDSPPITETQQEILKLQFKSSSLGNFEEIGFSEDLMNNQLGADEVEIIPHMVGLNFKDVIFSNGTFPEKAFRKGDSNRKPPFGLDCAGVISRVGSNVDEFKEGDEVIALSLGSLASRVVTSRYLTVPKPSNLSMEQASTIPIVFTTAYLALCNLGNIQNNEKCLVHLGSGGVGLAAIQILQNCFENIEIFTTVGSHNKKEYLEDHYGIKNILNSRDLTFVQEVMKITKGEGVDVILNSLSGDAFDYNFELLSDFGRLIEIGIKDVYQNRKIASEPFSRNLAYHLIDLDRYQTQKPKLMNVILKKLVKLFEEGVLKPLPTTLFKSTEISNALLKLSKGNHIGKIVIDMKEVYENHPLPTSLFGEGTYLITGGLKGLGLALGEWLVETQQVKSLALVGRSLPDERALQMILKLSKKAIVKHFQADLSQLTSVNNLIEEIQSTMQPLTSIFHLATTYDNIFLLDMPQQVFDQVIQSKAISAFNLHKSIENIQTINKFVLFSSVSGVFGNSEQTAYASANTSLDNLAKYRNSKGLPAVSISFGPIRGEGFLANNYTVQKLLKIKGMISMSTNTVFRSLQELSTKQGHFVVGQIDWEKASVNYPDLAPFLGKLYVEREIKQDIVNVSSMITEHTIKVLGLSPGAINENTYGNSFKDFGLDSIASAQIKNWVDSKFGSGIVSQIELLQGLTLRKLEEKILQSMEKKTQVQKNVKSQPIKKVDIESIELEPIGSHTYSMIFLHGHGQSSSTYLSQFTKLRNSIPGLKIILPQAPFFTETNGIKTRNWLNSNSDTTQVSFQELFQSTHHLVNQLLRDEKKKSNLDYDRIILGGFSIGAAICSHIFIHRSTPKLGGLVLLSPFLLDEIHQVNAKENVTVLMTSNLGDKIVKNEKTMQVRDELAKKVNNSMLRFVQFQQDEHDIGEEQWATIQDYLQNLEVNP